ncbi:hypothetical protein [Sinosporangium siamense]|uniref:Uncharacterized protein n=1 Tax=Sinosporangium siamense TaxID=1367973 RepID=A0A919VAV3_9ACTN|nr:hypothetical protein [Sinosporangium siamense]GII91489.1 hypothetical protein Ssi02_17200 [Sinosporangium siamense]
MPALIAAPGGEDADDDERQVACPQGLDHAGGRADLRPHPEDAPDHGDLAHAVEPAERVAHIGVARGHVHDEQIVGFSPWLRLGAVAAGGQPHVAHLDHQRHTHFLVG